MKQLHEYDTPETDALYKDDHRPNVLGHARKLEQRLAACRDALRISVETMELVDGENDCSKAILICEETLTLTAPE